MGLQIGEIICKREIQFSDLKGKIIAVDAFNAIYQFLTTIRQPDGTPLKDSKGNVTSHLSGLFYRNMNLVLQFTAYRSDSNIAIYDYDRQIYSIGIEYRY